MYFIGLYRFFGPVDRKYGSKWLFKFLREGGELVAARNAGTEAACRPPKEISDCAVLRKVGGALNKSPG